MARVVPVLLWATLIFVLSAQPDLPRAPTSLLDLLLKKAAHVSEYAILAVLLHHAVGSPLTGSERGRVALAWTLALLYAVSDEIHQSSVPGRNAAGLDVLIDGVGAALGLCVREALARWRVRRATARAG